MTQLAVEPAVPPGSGPTDPEEAKSWRLGRALLESSREEARYRTSNFYEDWRFTLGENHWPAPQSYRSVLASRWQNRSVRNWTWATIDFKAAVLLDADPMIHVEPLDETSTFEQRQHISQAIRHELERLRWSEFVEDMVYDGAVCGKGLIHVRIKVDKLAEAQGMPMHEIMFERVDPQRFYPDPSATRLKECRFVVYEPILDMSTIREIFPEKAHLITPTITTDLFRYQDSLGYTRTDQDLVEGTSGAEYVYGRDGTIKQRRAEVAFIWIKDETLTQDIVSSVIKEGTMGFQCVNCGSQFEPEEAIPVYPEVSGMTDMNGEAIGRACPECGAEGMLPVDLPAVTETKMEMSRKYPFGRLIVLCGKVLLYDGPNPYDIDCVFPFVEYNHYRVPRRFWGYGDTALLKSSQRVVDKNMSQAVDALRLMANGVFERPSEAEAYDALGNQPGQQIPVPAPFCGLARYVTPNGFDRALFQLVDSLCMNDFQRVAGVSDVSTGIAPTPATSGVEVQARQRAASTRIGLHLKRLNAARSDLASICHQLMNQFYVGPRYFMDPMQAMNPASNAQAIAFDYSQLPRGVRVLVTADPDDIERDRQMGQNLAMTIQSGGLTNPMIVPFLDIYLRAIGLPRNMANEVQRRAMFAMGMQPPATAEPGQEDGAADTGGAPGSAPSGDMQIPTGMMNEEAAYQAQGVA